MIPNKIIKIMKNLELKGFEAYIIGGAVRDILLNKKPNDYDIFTDATGSQILKLFPKGKIIGNEERQEKILTVVVGNVEISQFRSNGARTETGKSLTEHQHTCDFTINSIAMDRTQKTFDINNGRYDLKHKLLKFVGLPLDRVEEDPLRLLRGIRFAAKYNFDLNLDDIDMECREKSIAGLSQERVHDELIKILKYDKGMGYLILFGFLELIFPECKDVKGMNGGDHHDEIVDRHMLNAFEEACKVTDNPLLRLACFLHDIGKGVTQTFEGEVGQDMMGNETIKELGKQTHFYEHETMGEAMIEQRLLKLKFSTDEIKYITKLIRLHMYTYKDKPSKKSYIRFFNKLEQAKIPIEDYIMLIYSDHQGNMAKPRIKFGDFVRDNWLHKKYYEIKYSEEPMNVTDLKVGGDDVIKIMKIKPGPLIGDTLNNIFSLVMDGELKNERAELLNYLKKGYK